MHNYNSPSLRNFWITKQSDERVKRQQGASWLVLLTGSGFGEDLKGEYKEASADLGRENPDLNPMAKKNPALFS